MRPINSEPIANGIANYLATNAYLNDTAQDALGMVWTWVNEAPTVEAIPIAVIKRAIAGISMADQCDQAGRYERELRDALNKVLEWYGSPGYEEHAERTAHG